MTKDGLQDVDWESLRRAYRESIRSDSRTPERHATGSVRNTEDGGAYRDTCVYGDEYTTEKTPMEYSAHGLPIHNRPNTRGPYHNRSGKGDIDSIATIIAALVAMIMTGTLIARYWLVLFPH